jgi:hypothetical protein
MARELTMRSPSVGPAGRIALVVALCAVMAACSGASPRPAAGGSATQVASAPPPPGSPVGSGPDTRQHVVTLHFDFTGHESAYQLTATGKLTSFSKPVPYRFLNWDIKWHYACTATDTFVGSAVNSSIGCLADGTMSGTSSVKDISAPSENCKGTISNIPGAKFGIGGFFTDKYGGVLHVTTGEPEPGAVWVTTPSTCYPAQNIIWSHGGPDIGFTTPDLFIHNTDTGEDDVPGEVSGYDGTVTYDSQLVVTLVHA